ncbi:MAG: hypothetical protein LKJ83_10655 [Eubacteriaceae bacterium]|jgi:hypothetical protein|nr:hypothetical protein [Eubacteriaceae bacterium]
MAKDFGMEDNGKIEVEEVSEDTFEKEPEVEDSIPIDADFTIEKTEDAEEEYNDETDEEYADFNYAGMKAKKERELKQRSRIVVVMLITAAIAACIILVNF